MIATLGVIVLLSTLVNAQFTEPKEGTVLAIFETVGNWWSKSFRPYHYTGGITNPGLPQIMTTDYRAYQFNYTCTLDPYCPLLSNDDCEYFRPQIRCLPDLPSYPLKFLNTSYENLTTLWCEKVRPGRTIVLSSNIEKGDVIIWNSCFLVVKTGRNDFADDIANSYIISATMGILVLFICVHLYFWYHGQLSMPFV